MGELTAVGGALENPSVLGLGSGSVLCGTAAASVAEGALGAVAVGAELQEAKAAAHTAALAAAAIRRNLTSTG